MAKGRSWFVTYNRRREIINRTIKPILTPDAGRDWGQEEKGTTEDEMVGWHHQLNGHEFE